MKLGATQSLLPTQMGRIPATSCRREVVGIRIGRRGRPTAGLCYFLQTIATWNGEPSEIVRVPASGGEPQAVVRTTRRALFPLPTADGGLLYAANPSGVDLDLWFAVRTTACRSV